MSLFRTLREFLQQTETAARNLVSNPPTVPIPTNAMPLINLPLALGGTVAALVVVSKYPTRKEDTAGEAARRKVGAFVVAGAPGIIIAQVAYDVASHHIPYLAKIPSLSLGVGLILGGCGLPIFLALREKLPEALTAGLMAWVQSKVPGAKPEADRPKTSTAPSDEPLETTP